MHPREFKDNDLFLTKKEAFAIDDERRRLIQENEKLTGQLRKIDRELSMLKYKESESFDRTASHMANEYVEYKEPILTDEEINLLAKAYSTMEGELNAPAFARAILKKAQKK